MPSMATLVGTIVCPVCKAPLWESVRFQWGIIPHRVAYRIGDRIEWLRDSAGSVIPPFTPMEVAPKECFWNCGGPEHERVLVFDEVWYPKDNGFVCSKCSTGVETCVVSIVDGVVSEARALTSSEVDSILGASRGKADVALIRPDGSYEVREDWFDHVLRNGGPLP